MLRQAMHYFRRRYERIGEINTFEVHLRLDCLLVALVQMKSQLAHGVVGFDGVDVLAFELDLAFVVRYAMTELSCYFKVLCKFGMIICLGILILL